MDDIEDQLMTVVENIDLLESHAEQLMQIIRIEGTPQQREAVLSKMLLVWSTLGQTVQALAETCKNLPSSANTSAQPAAGDIGTGAGGAGGAGGAIKSEDTAAPKQSSTDNTSVRESGL